MTIKFRLAMVGTHPLLMHNARLSDPLEPICEEISKVTGKRKKTKADHLELMRLEFLGGLYHNEEFGVHIPGLNVHACLVEAAKLSRLGKNVERALYIDDMYIPLNYDGPSEPAALSKDRNFLLRDSRKVQRNRVMRNRPRFRQWSLVTSGIFDESILDLDAVKDIAVLAGAMIGLGDSRPMYGRFLAQVDAIDSDDSGGGGGQGSLDLGKPAKVGA